MKPLKKLAISKELDEFRRTRQTPAVRSSSANSVNSSELDELQRTPKHSARFDEFFSKSLSVDQNGSCSRKNHRPISRFQANLERSRHLRTKEEIDGGVEIV
ncbi:hypothetical protein Bca4012_065717 [Brassica carinata]